MEACDGRLIEGSEEERWSKRAERGREGRRDLASKEFLGSATLAPEFSVH